MNKDYFELNDELEESKKAIYLESIREENKRNYFATRETKELHEMAEYLERKDIEEEHEELVELAKYAAIHNPFSDSALDVREEMITALRAL